MINRRSPFSIILILIIFTWFCVVGEFTFAQNTDEDLLIKARKMSYTGDYEGAVNLLKDFIVKFKIKQGKKEDLALAYYLLGRTYYKVGMDDQCDEKLHIVFEMVPEFTTDEMDLMFREYVKKIQEKVRIKLLKEVPKEKKVKIEKKQPDTKAKKKAVEKSKPKVKRAETKPEKKVIPKISKKKSKKKFPWLLVIGGVAVVGVILYFLLKKKDTEENGSNNYDTDVLGLEWIHIPAGEFLMGDNFNIGNLDERPVHAVYLDSYSISRYEVTFEQFDAFCYETGRTRPHDEGWGRGNLPVINVSWNDAQAFCDWLAQKTNKNIHLPTEAQWEKAARGTDQRKYPWGNSDPNCSIVNSHFCYGMTKPVGSYPSGVSSYGVHDMAGNVWELCADWYSYTYYSVSPYHNPTGPNSGSFRVIRGGSWKVTGNLFISSFYRYDLHPSVIKRDSGFRLAMSN